MNSDDKKSKLSLVSERRSQTNLFQMDDHLTKGIPTDDLEELSLDFECFGKKKKKKKKPLNWGELDKDNTPCTSRQALLMEENEDGGGSPTPTPSPKDSPNTTPTATSPRLDVAAKEDTDLDFDFSSTKKKKKKVKSCVFEADATKEEDKYVNEEDNLSLDFECFGKKKKKKKKIINLEELDNLESTSSHSLQSSTKHTARDETNSINPLPSAMSPASPLTTLDDTLELDMDFSLGKKKKKTKRKELNDLGLGDRYDEDKFNAIVDGEYDPNAPSWTGSSRDYTYDELLKRVFDMMLEKNPELGTGRKPKFIMRPPQVLRVGSKKTLFTNFMDIAKTLHRLPKHLLDFLSAELGTSGSMDGNQQLIIKGRFQAKQIENVLRRYIKEYVTCHTCRSPETILQKNTRLLFLQCESCGSRFSVASIKSGFQAVTGKRAAIRAKYT